MYRLSDNQISTSMSGESVILNHKKGEYYTLNEVATVVWGVLQEGPASIEKMMDAVMDQYEVDAETCRRDIEVNLRELLDEQLIENN